MNKKLNLIATLFVGLSFLTACSSEPEPTTEETPEQETPKAELASATINLPLSNDIRTDNSQGLIYFSATVESSIGIQSVTAHVEGQTIGSGCNWVNESENECKTIVLAEYGKQHVYLDILDNQQQTSSRAAAFDIYVKPYTEKVSCDGWYEQQSKTLYCKNLPYKINIEDFRTEHLSHYMLLNSDGKLWSGNGYRFYHQPSDDSLYQVSDGNVYKIGETYQESNAISETTENSPDISYVSGDFFDVAKNEIYINNGSEIVNIDLTTGVRTIVSDSNSSEDNNIVPSPITKLEGFIYSISSNKKELIKTSINNGERNVLSLLQPDANYDIGNLITLASSEELGSIFIVDDLHNLYRFDTEENNIELVSNFISNPDINQRVAYLDAYSTYQIPGFFVDIEKNRILLHRGLHGLLAINLENGERTNIGTVGRGTGPKALDPIEAIFDNLNRRVLVLTRNYPNDPGTIVSFDPITGERKYVLDSQSLTSFDGLYFGDFVIGNTSGRLFVYESTQQKVYEYFESAGALFEVSQFPQGLDNSMMLNPKLLINNSEKKLYLARNGSTKLYELDLVSGIWRLVSDGQNDSQGPAFGVGDMTFTNDDSTILMIGSNLNGSVYINTDTGERTKVLPSETDDNNHYVFGIAYDQSNEIVYLEDYGTSAGHSINGVMKAFDIKTLETQLFNRTSIDIHGELVVDPTSGYVYGIDDSGVLKVFDRKAGGAFIVSD